MSRAPPGARRVWAGTGPASGGWAGVCRKVRPARSPERGLSVRNGQGLLAARHTHSFLFGAAPTVGLPHLCVQPLFSSGFGGSASPSPGPPVLALRGPTPLLLLLGLLAASSAHPPSPPSPPGTTAPALGSARRHGGLQRPHRTKAGGAGGHNTRLSRHTACTKTIVAAQAPACTHHLPHEAPLPRLGPRRPLALSPHPPPPRMCHTQRAGGVCVHRAIRGTEGAARTPGGGGQSGTRPPTPTTLHTHPTRLQQTSTMPPYSYVNMSLPPWYTHVPGHQSLMDVHAM